jgi:hypothetical protein
MTTASGTLLSCDAQHAQQLQTPPWVRLLAAGRQQALRADPSSTALQRINSEANGAGDHRHMVAIGLRY